MKENLFRGIRKVDGEFEYGNLISNDDHSYIFPKNLLLATIFSFHDVYEVDKETVGICTELTDVNNEHIFEGDRCRCSDGYFGDTLEHGFDGIVRYEDGGFVLVGPDPDIDYHQLDSCTIYNRNIEIIK